MKYKSPLIYYRNLIFIHKKRPTQKNYIYTVNDPIFKFRVWAALLYIIV